MNHRKFTIICNKVRISKDPKNRKHDVKPKSGVKEDENRKPDNKKRDVKNTSDGNGEKRRDVNNDSDEDLVIKQS